MSDSELSDVEQPVVAKKETKKASLLRTLRDKRQALEKEKLDKKQARKK